MSEDKKPQYPEGIRKAVMSLCVELRKHYPNAFEQTYDNHGFPTTEGSKFQQRMEMGVYIELMKAGEKFEDFHKEHCECSLT